jgi:hypothetical protein
MSKWPLNGRLHKFILISILTLGCLLLFSPAAANVSNVQLTITPEDICEDNNVTVSFHVTSGLVGGVGGIYVTFDQNVTIDDAISKGCINITNEDGAYGNPINLWVIHNFDPDYAEFNFPNGTTTLKMTTPVNVPQNSVVTLNFTCDVDIDCPCDCGGYVVWANTDLEKVPVMSNTVFMKVRIQANAMPHGTVKLLPSGPTAPPTFNTTFGCCNDASYLVKADDPCYIIDHVDVIPLCFAGCICPEINPINATTWYVNFTDVNCCFNLTAYFSVRTCNVTAVAHDGGRIQSPPTLMSPGYVWSPPNQTKTFTCGENATYFIKPNISYSIEDVRVNNQSVVGAANWTSYENGSASYRYYSNCTNATIEAFFKQSPVDAFLKYQLPKDQCGQIVEVQVRGMDEIGPMVELADDLYLGGNSSTFNLTGQPGSFNFGYYSGGTFIDGGSSGTDKILDATVTTPPTTNPETYKVTYSDGTTTRYATVTILLDGTTVWAPAIPSDVRDVTNVKAQMPAWQMVTQDYLDHNPDWEGLVGLVIYVDDGVYHETFEVDTPGVHLKNFPGAIPVIDADGLTPAGSGDTESAVFLSAGCTGIEGFTIVDSEANGIAVYPSSEKCANATILDWVSGDNVSVPCQIGRINIVNNTITDSEANGIRVIDAVVLIMGNIIQGNVDDGIDAGCLYTGVECVDPEAITHDPAASEIIYNEISDNGPSENGEWEVGEPPRFTSDPTACGEYPGWTDSGIQIRCIGEGRQGINQTLYIVHNNVYENFHAGIFLMDDATLGGNLTIQANHLIDNGIFGMLTEAEVPSQIDFRWNDIIGNTYWGVKNLDEDDLIAKENYWGEPGGPSEGPAPIVQCIDCRCHEEDQRSNALGNGDAVSHRIHYNPWLYVSSADIFHDGGNPQYLTRSYGSDSLLLQKGWNTLSVPCMLSEEADTISEIVTLGDFITSQNAVVIYQWDAVSDMWVDIGYDSEKIVPGQGYYILMKEPSRFPVLFNNNPSPGLPSVALEDGWNLIGAPWGIDREKDCCADDEGRWAVASPDDGDPEAFKLTYEALESIKEGNGGTKGVAIIVSPSVPGQISIYSASVTSGFWDPIYNNKEMATGEGYWVFMVNPATYAGFEITPFYIT